MKKQTIWLMYVACKNKSEARKIAKLVVTKKLAACANMIPQIESIYLWNQKLQNTNETILILKTSQKNLTSLKNLILKLHSYDCPGIVAWKLPFVEKNYAKWIQQA